MYSVSQCTVLVLALVLLGARAERPDNAPLTIGILTDDDVEQFFHCHSINQTALARANLVVTGRRVTSSDPIAAVQAVCSLLDEGVASIIDATSHRGIRGVLSSMCATHHITCISVWSTDRNGHREGKLDDDFSGESQSFTFNLAPSRAQIAIASRDILRGMGWRSFVLVYDSMEHLATAEEILLDSFFNVTLLRMSDVKHAGRILLKLQQTSTRRVVLILRQRLLQHLAAQTQNSPEAKQFGNTNYFIVNPEVNKRTRELLFTTLGPVTALTLSNHEPGEALLSDAVSLIGSASKTLIGRPETGLCSTQGKWSEGKKFSLSLASLPFSGKTGPVYFRPDGSRTDFEYTLLKQLGDGNKRIFKWPLLGDSDDETVGQRLRRDLKEITGGVKPVLRVGAVLSVPYVMEVHAHENETVDDEEEVHYEGICIDILDELSAELGFTYEIMLPEDGAYGSWDEETGWTGVIGDLVDQRIDLAIGDLSVTETREKVVDFTEPWMSFGIGLLSYDVTQDFEYNTILFLSPLSEGVWLLLLLSCFGVGILLFLLSRLNPYERQASAEQDCQRWSPYTLCNSLWFIFGTAFRQFVVVQPRSTSSRILITFWWFFIIFVFALYLANLVHFVAWRIGSSYLQSIYDLPNQRAVKYGALYGGSTWSFLQNSESETLQRIYSFMKHQPETSRVSSNQEGIERVIEGHGTYAYFMEEPSLQYITERNCEVMQIGTSVGTRSFAIAFQQDSIYADAFNDALQIMVDSGQIKALRALWWMQKDGGGQCKYERETFDGTAFELDVEEFLGLFVLLVIGAALAVIAGVIECIYHSAVAAKEKETSVCEEIVNNLRQAAAGPHPPPSITVTTEG